RVRRTLDEAQAARRESEDRYRDLVENSQDLFCTHDIEGRLISVNAAAYRTLGYEPGSLVGTNLRDVLAPATREQFAAYLDELAAKGGASGRMAVQTRDGKLRYWEYHNTLRTEGVPAPIVRGMARDVTDAQLAGRALRESERRFRATFEQAAVGIAIVAPDGRWLQVNDKLCRIVGYGREELLAGNFQSVTHPEGVEGDLDAARRMLAGEIDTYRTEKRYLRKDGTTVWGNLTVALARHGDGSPAYFISVVEDIQDRKLAELALRAAEEQFRGLIDQSIAGIWVIQDGKFSFVNPRCVEIFGYQSAAELVGLDPASVIAQQDRARVAALMRRRLEGEVPHESYEFTGLRKDGSTIDVGAHGARATYGGKPALIAILQDISEKRRAEEQIRDYVAQLETAFMSTVEVATNLSEMRDPYTAGHERRVAEVAAAIGAELGFDGRRQEGLRVAGHLHDIGKIMVPAEILAKPGRLSPIEYQLIQGHPRAGHDALKDVKFPWPVAEVTLQHHERMDGSGYPQGLKGDAILLEARVLAVADVIEAMSSHRPYRPGLGTDAALAEIERGRGKVYDADV
ncbi:MAG: PAS domain S-box protein, partial [Burkholderiales bacterium]